MRWQSYYDEATQSVRAGKIIWHIFLIVIVIVAFSYAGKLIFFPVKVAQEVAEETFDGSRMIYVYETYFNMYADVQATAGKLQNHQDALNRFMVGHPNPDNWTYNQQQEYGRLSDAVLSVKNILYDQVNHYNAEAGKINKKFLLDDNLPDTLRIEDYVSEDG